MRTILFSVSLLLFFIKGFAQAPLNPNHDRDYYLQKSKKQRTIGWITFGGGLGLGIIGAAAYKGDAFTGPTGSLPLQVDRSTNTISDILVPTGLAAMLTGLTYLYLAGQNKKKAESLSISNLSIYLPQYGSLGRKSQPSISYTISF